MTYSAGAKISAELWLNICNQFPQQTRDDYTVKFVALNHLSRTSQALRAIAQPILWSNFTNVSAMADALLCFTHRSVAYLKLARYLRDIELVVLKETTQSLRNLPMEAKAVDADSSSPGRSHDSLLPSHDNLFQASGQDSSDRNLTQQPLSQPSWSTLPNLERMSLQKASGYDFPFSQDFRVSKACFLSNMREIHLQDGNEIDGFQANAVAGLLSLSNLRIVTLHEAVGIDASVELPRNESLKQLRLLEFVLSRDHFPWITTIFPSLEALEYEVADAEVTQSSDIEDVTAMGFVHAIQLLKASLKHLALVLTGTYRGEDEFYVDNRVNEVASFVTFVRLESLKVDGTSLLGTSKSEEEYSSMAISGATASFRGLFPPSLISLSLVEVYSHFVGPFQELSMEVKEQLPHLRFLHIGFCREKHFFGDHCLMSEQRDSKSHGDRVIVGEHEPATEKPTHETQGDHWDDLARNIPAITDWPHVWQDIIATFSRAGVRVSIDRDWEESQMAYDATLFTGWVS